MRNPSNGRMPGALIRVVQARGRRAWVRVVFIVCLSLAVVGTGFAFRGEHA